MTEPRRIAIVRTMDELHGAMRARAEELRMSRATLDAISGLPNGYSGKLLAPDAIKTVGRKSLGPMLETLGLQIFVVEDTEALARIQRRSDAEARTESQVRTADVSDVVNFSLSLRHMKKLSKLATEKRKKFSASKRRQIARKAARTRRRNQQVRVTGSPAAVARLTKARPVRKRKVKNRRGAGRSSSSRPATAPRARALATLHSQCGGVAAI